MSGSLSRRVDVVFTDCGVVDGRLSFCAPRFAGHAEDVDRVENPQRVRNEQRDKPWF